MDVVILVAFILFTSVAVIDIKDDAKLVLEKQPNLQWTIFMVLILFILLAWFISNQVFGSTKQLGLVDSLSYVFFLIMFLRVFVYFLKRKVIKS